MTVVAYFHAWIPIDGAAQVAAVAHGSVLVARTVVLRGSLIAQWRHGFEVGA